MTRFISGFIILHVMGLALLYSAFRADLLLPFLLADEIGLTPLVMLVGFLGVGCVALRRWDDVKLIREGLPLIGLLFTVVGFAMGIEGITLDAPDLTMLGLHTALNTTIAGIGGSIWLLISERILRGSTW